MSQVKNVRLSSLHPNPHRDMGTYPLVADKIATLVRSINDVGFWEGVIARPAKQGYELAFGHHRVEAARAADLKTIPVIVRDLTDEQMLQFMGRENGEDYKAEFLIMLNTWEAGMAAARARGDIEIARILGWTRTDVSGENLTRTNDVANACASAAKLIAGSHLERADLEGLNVFQARSLCQSTATMIRNAEKNAAARGGDAKPATEAVARAAKRVAGDVREGRVAPKEIRTRVQGEVLGGVRVPKDAPLFAAFGHHMATKLSSFMFDDDVADKLEMIVENLRNIHAIEDTETVEKIANAVGRLSKRAIEWERKLRNQPKLRAIQGGK